MYLTVLSNKEKEMFLDLAYVFSSVDGNYSDAEKTIIAGYCQEMQIEIKEPTMNVSVDELINQIDEISSDKEKRIIVFEIIGLVMVDGNYDVKERELVRKMIEVFGIDISFVEACEKLISEYITFQIKINKLVLN